jgi:hypothetical protein
MSGIDDEGKNFYRHPITRGLKLNSLHDEDLAAQVVALKEQLVATHKTIHNLEQEKAEERSKYEMQVLEANGKVSKTVEETNSRLESLESDMTVKMKSTVEGWARAQNQLATSEANKDQIVRDLRAESNTACSLRAQLQGEAGVNRELRMHVQYVQAANGRMVALLECAINSPANGRTIVLKDLPILLTENEKARREGDIMLSTITQLRQAHEYHLENNTKLRDEVHKLSWQAEEIPKLRKERDALQAVVYQLQLQLVNAKGMTPTSGLVQGSTSRTNPDSESGVQSNKLGDSGCESVDYHQTKESGNADVQQSKKKRGRPKKGQDGDVEGQEPETPIAKRSKRG